MPTNQPVFHGMSCTGFWSLLKQAHCRRFPHWRERSFSLLRFAWKTSSAYKDVDNCNHASRSRMDNLGISRPKKDDVNRSQWTKEVVYFRVCKTLCIVKDYLYFQLIDTISVILCHQAPAKSRSTCFKHFPIFEMHPCSYSLSTLKSLEIQKKYNPEMQPFFSLTVEKNHMQCFLLDPPRDIPGLPNRKGWKPGQKEQSSTPMIKKDRAVCFPFGSPSLHALKKMQTDPRLQRFCRSLHDLALAASKIPRLASSYMQL